MSFDGGQDPEVQSGLHRFCVALAAGSPRLPSIPALARPLSALFPLQLVVLLLWSPCFDGFWARACVDPRTVFPLRRSLDP